MSFSAFHSPVTRLSLPLCALRPIRYSKRIFEIAVPLPVKKGGRPKHAKGKSVRRNSTKQPDHAEDASTQSTPHPDSTPNPTTIDCSSETASTPPQSTNAGGGPPETRKATKPRRARLTEEEKRERKRKRAAEQRQRKKDNGRCVSCPNTPIEGQTRCPDCAAKHRAWLLPYSEARRRAQGAKPTPRISEAELLRLIQKEVDARESQVSNQSVEEMHSGPRFLSRVQRKSLGICSDCDYPSEEGHTRCTLCLLRHRLYCRRRRAKVQAVPSAAENYGQTVSKTETAEPASVAQS